MVVFWLNMPRPPRIDFPNAVYHVTSRGNGRDVIFWSDDDRTRFLAQLADNLHTAAVLLYAFVLMDNHVHAVVWPESDGDLSAFMQQITNMHVKRWKEHRHEVGYGHLYQGRYKCFPVETERYFYQVVRYVERNAGPSKFGGSCRGLALVEPEATERDDPAFPILSDWPLPRPSDWLQIVNQPQSEAELDASNERFVAVVPSAAPFGPPRPRSNSKSIRH